MAPLVGWASASSSSRKLAPQPTTLSGAPSCGVQLVGPDDGSSPAVEQAKSLARAAANGLTLEFRSVKYSRAELEQLSDRIFPTQKQWAAGLTEADSLWDPERNCVVFLVRNDKGDTQAWADRIKALNDDRVVFEPYTPASDQLTDGIVKPQSRIHDTPPWFGGAWLALSTVTATTTNALCTAGFNWRLWSSGEYFGSTADHCNDAGGGGDQIYFYNDKRPFGVWDSGESGNAPVPHSEAADTTLLRGFPYVSSFGPSVFVGDQGTTTTRFVRGVAAPAVGKTVAIDRVEVHPGYQQIAKVDKPSFKPLWCLNTCAKVTGLYHLDWDFALLRLASPASGSNHVELLDDKTALVGGLPLAALGWGDTDPSATTSPSSDLRITPNGSLELASQPGFPKCSDGISVLCVSGNGTSGTGAGDSGGPWFTTTSAGKIVQVGVTSFGPGVGQTSALNPEAIQSIPAAIKWIRSRTGIAVGAAPTADNVATALVIDNSGSMSSNDPDLLRRDASVTYVNTAVPGDYVGAVGFEDTAYDIAAMGRLPDVKHEITTALNSGIYAGGSTNIGAGLTQACAMLDSATLPTRRAAILLTDGVGGYTDEDSCFTSKGWHVYTIGLGTGVDTDLLERIARETGGIYQPVPAAVDIPCKFQQVRALVAGGDPPPCQSDLIQLGQTLTKVVHVANRLAQMTFSTNWPGSDVQMTLVSPSGRRIGRDTTAWDVTHSQAATHEEYVIRVPEPGDWTIELYGAEVAPAGEEVVFGTSPVPFENQLPNVSATSLQTGAPNTWKFTAEASDPDGSVANLVWDFGDGQSATGMDISHYYGQPGQYQPTVTAIDDQGETSIFSLPTITVAVDSRAPTASFSVTTNGLTVSVDARNSVTPSGSIIHYFWDFDGDGTTDLDTVSPTATWTYQADGTYPASLGVENSDGYAALTSHQVTVAKQDVAPGLTVDYGSGPKRVKTPVRILVGSDGIVYGVFASGRDGQLLVTLSLTNPTRNSKGVCTRPGRLCTNNLVGVLTIKDQSSGLSYAGVASATGGQPRLVKGTSAGLVFRNGRLLGRLTVPWSANS